MSKVILTKINVSAKQWRWQGLWLGHICLSRNCVTCWLEETRTLKARDLKPLRGPKISEFNSAGQKLLLQGSCLKDIQCPIQQGVILFVLLVQGWHDHTNSHSAVHRPKCGDRGLCRSFAQPAKHFQGNTGPCGGIPLPSLSSILSYQ